MKIEGEPGYDASADFDRNGIINISDFGLLGLTIWRYRQLMSRDNEFYEDDMNKGNGTAK